MNIILIFSSRSISSFFIILSKMLLEFKGGFVFTLRENIQFIKNRVVYAMYTEDLNILKCVCPFLERNVLTLKSYKLFFKHYFMCVKSIYIGSDEIDALSCLL